MGLKLFSFIDEVAAYLEESRSELEVASKEIEKYFEDILIDSNEGYLNINTRVKSSFSLKEKIIRNNYYNKYSKPKELLANLSDLIGIRVECRFIQDENVIYKTFKKHFNKVYYDGFYYNEENDKVRLDLNGKQPQEQKNGFKIFRIDGRYDHNGEIINFELQIKSLVNIFWGEIEHKIIYKNNNYLLGDGFLRDIMSSIKKNLTMIDHQLLIIYNQFNTQNSINPVMRKNQIEKLLSKIIYDIFSMKMSDNIGFIVDFRRACDTIMKYILRPMGLELIGNYSDKMVKIMARLNDIAKNKMNFDEEIPFERDITFESDFCKCVGGEIINQLNNEFQWNLFFRILFEIEVGNNAEDFETFIKFLEFRFYNSKGLQRLDQTYDNDMSKMIKEDIMMELANIFVDMNSMEFIFDDNIEKMNREIEDISDIISSHIASSEEWGDQKDIYLSLLNLRIMIIFDKSISTTKAKDLIEEVRYKSNNIDISEIILKYLDKLNSLETIKAEEVVKIFRIK